MIDGCSAWDVRVINRCEIRFNRHIVMLNWREVVGSYSTADNVVRDRRMK